MKLSKILTLSSMMLLTLITLCSCGECKHEDTEWQIVAEPTCLSDGVQQNICSTCDAIIKIGKIDKLVHANAPAIEEKRIEATCTVDGSYDTVVYCSVCNGEVSRETKVITAHGHTSSPAVEENKVDATCTVDGSYDSVVYCSACHIELSRKKQTSTIADHKYNNRKCVYCGEKKASEGLSFVSNGDGTCFVSGIGMCGDENLVIPEKSQKGDIVIRIGSYAFADCLDLTSLEFVNNSKIESIGYGAFEGCTNLTRISIHSRIKEIGRYAFYECYSLNSVIFSGKSELSTIASSAFSKCYRLVKIDIPESVERIEDHAFASCDMLEKVTFAEKSSITSIEKFCFYNCKKLAVIKIPQKVSTIGDYAFMGCENLLGVEFDKNSALEEIRTCAFYGCKSLMAMILPPKVARLGSLAFWGCENMGAVSFFKSMKIISESAFEGCGLKYVYYEGTSAEFLEISIGPYNNTFLSAQRKYNYVFDLYL